MAFSTRFRFRQWPRVVAGALGDMVFRASNGNLTPVGGTKTEGYAPVIQGDGTVAWAEVVSSGGMTPTYIGPAEVFTIPDNRQAFYAMAIDNEGLIDIGDNSFLIEVG